MLSGKHRSIYQNFVFNPSISGCHAFENTYTSFIVESDERDKNKCIPHKENIIETNISREGDALCDFMYIVETKLSLEQIKNKIRYIELTIDKSSLRSYDIIISKYYDKPDTYIVYSKETSITIPHRAMQYCEIIYSIVLDTDEIHIIGNMATHIGYSDYIRKLFYRDVVIFGDNREFAALRGFANHITINDANREFFATYNYETEHNIHGIHIKFETDDVKSINFDKNFYNPKLITNINYYIEYYIKSNEIWEKFSKQSYEIRITQIEEMEESLKIRSSAFEALDKLERIRTILNS